MLLLLPGERKGRELTPYLEDSGRFMRFSPSSTSKSNMRSRSVCCVVAMSLGQTFTGQREQTHLARLGVNIDDQLRVDHSLNMNGSRIFVMRKRKAQI